jgi:hypothetical protein
MKRRAVLAKQQGKHRLRGTPTCTTRIKRRKTKRRRVMKNILVVRSEGETRVIWLDILLFHYLLYDRPHHLGPARTTRLPTLRYMRINDITDGRCGSEPESLSQLSSLPRFLMAWTCWPCYSSRRTMTLTLSYGHFPFSDLNLTSMLLRGYHPGCLGLQPWLYALSVRYLYFFFLSTRELSAPGPTLSQINT